MDILYARGDPDFWDPTAAAPTPACAEGQVPDSVASSLPPFAPERFVPMERLLGPCPPPADGGPAFDSPQRELAATRSALAQAWSRLADGVVVISLREAGTRRALLAEEMRMVGLLPENADRILCYVADRPTKQGGGFGCLRSHAAVAVEAGRRGWKRWVVFEDDAFFLPVLSAGLLHNMADALDVEPGMALLGMGTIVSLCEAGGPHDNRSVYPVRYALGATCYVATPAFSKRMEVLNGPLGDPEETVDLMKQDRDLLADRLFYISDLLKEDGVYHVLPNPVSQRNTGTMIGYAGIDDARIGSWLVRTFSLAPLLKRASHPAIRSAAADAVSATAVAMVVLGALAVLVVGALRRRRRRGRG